MKYLILLFVVLLSFANLVFANDSILKEISCGSNNFAILDSQTNSISNSNKDFKKILSKVDKTLSNKKYNLIVSLGSRPSGGYKLEFNKIKNKKKKTYVYFSEIKPPKNSKNIAVISYPFCLVNIENLDEYKVKIKKKRLKFFPLSIFN